LSPFGAGPGAEDCRGKLKNSNPTLSFTETSRVVSKVGLVPASFTSPHQFETFYPTSRHSVWSPHRKGLL